jgi:hypothetical protein
MWRVTAGNGLPRCQGYRWVRFGLLGSSFGGGLAAPGRGGCESLSESSSGVPDRLQEEARYRQLKVVIRGQLGPS